MTTHDRIRAFLALPAWSLPAAQYLDAPEGNAWRQLRDYVRPAHRRVLNHLGERIRLYADVDGWRDGHTVTLEDWPMDGNTIGEAVSHQ